MKTITIDNKEIEISDESFKELKRQLIKEENRFVPKDGQKYWYIIFGGYKCKAKWENKRSDIFKLGQGNVFETEAEAEEHEKYLQAISKITNYCYENNLEVKNLNWNDEKQEKYYIFYAFAEKEYSCLYDIMNKTATTLPSLKSEDACKQVIKNCKKELDIIFKI